MSDRAYDFRLIPIELIDEPEFAMRETMDEQGLEELAANIRDRGLIQAISVRAVGDRFRVAAGHRRRIACGMAHESPIPCFVIGDDDDVEESTKIAENWLREETNPAEEATYFAHLLENRYNGAIEPLCRALSVTESRVNGRLELLRGDARVLDALRRKQIPLGVARELNRFKKPDWIYHYLCDAIEFGATVSVVQRWRIEYERREALADPAAAAAAAGVAPSDASPIASVDRCLLCALEVTGIDGEFVRVHRDCHSAHRRMQAAALAQGQA